MRLGNIYLTTGRDVDAEAAYDRALTIARKLTRDHPQVAEYQNHLASILNNLGISYKGAMRFDEAEREFRASLTILEKLAGAHPDVPKYQRWLHAAVSYFVSLVARYPGRSEKDYAEALRLAEMYIEPGKESSSWREVGWARYRNGQWQQAIEALETSIKLDENTGGVRQWIFLSMAHWQLGNKAEAHEWYVKSITGRAKSKNEEWLRFLAEADELLGMPVVVGHTDVVESIVFSPDGQTVASASGDKTIRLWNAKTGTLLQTLRGHAKAVRAVAFSPDGKSLVSASLDMTVRLWDTASGKLIRVLGRHDGGLRAVAFSPTGKLVASAGDDRMIRLWNPDSGELVTELSGHTAEIRGLAFSPDGRLLASASGKKGSKNTDWTARVWDVATRQQVHMLTGHSGAVRTVAFSPDGKTLAVGGAGIKLWDLAKGKSVTFPQIISSLEEATVNSLTARAPGRRTNPTGSALKRRQESSQ